MPKYTLHNEHGDYMSDNARTLEAAKKKADELRPFKIIVNETYYAPAPFYPHRMTAHGREVYRNF